jgi:hypothetical protein
MLTGGRSALAPGKLKRVELADGATVDLCDAPRLTGGTWNSEGAILFTPITWRARKSLLCLSATGLPKCCSRLGDHQGLGGARIVFPPSPPE